MPYYGWDEEYLAVVRSSIKKFCDKELTREYVRWMDENVDFPPEELWRKFVDFGYFARGIPEEYGGSGPAENIYESLILQEEIAAASVAVMLAIGAAHGFGTGFISALGNEEQRREFLPIFWAACGPQPKRTETITF
jgi:alkylation response protein AidB-like acyl-CoA dehydrogenase